MERGAVTVNKHGLVTPLIFPVPSKSRKGNKRSSSPVADKGLELLRVEVSLLLTLLHFQNKIHIRKNFEIENLKKKEGFAKNMNFS
jgi:hypothetical protein